MKKLGDILNTCIKVINLFFPIGIALIFAIVVTFSSWDKLAGWTDHTNDYFFIPTLNYKFFGFLFFLLVVLYIWGSVFVLESIAKARKLSKHIINVLTCIHIYIISVLCRAFYLFSANTNIQPFSDLQQVWEIANGDMSSLAYKSLFAAWTNFANFEHDFIQIFGNHYDAFLILNVLVSSVSSLAIWGILNHLASMNTDEEFNRTAIIGGLLYAFYPASSAYVVNGAPEIYVVPLYLIAVYLLIICNQIRKYGSYMSILFATLGGLFCGLSASFKSFSIVVIIAYILISVIDWLRNEKHIVRKDLLILLVCIISLLGTYSIVKSVELARTEKTFDVDLDYGSATAHYLLVGLNTEGEGQIHVGSLSRSFYRYILVDGISIDEATQKTRELLRENWKNNPEKIIPLFVKKGIWAWQDDTVPMFYYISQNANESSAKGIDYLKSVLPSMAQIFYLLTIFNALIGIIYVIKMREGNRNITFLNLIIIGYFCVIMLSEAQSNYKYLIMPLICSMAAIGIKQMSEIMYKFLASKICSSRDAK